MVRSGQICLYMVKSGQIWSNMSKGGQIWSNMSKVVSYQVGSQRRVPSPQTLYIYIDR
jgi:hypothetical protein